ncbi:AraC family transcriptional regulator [Streptomyces sp. 3211]|uniref:AraC family transcriptional regulator n=1 Tax=Streptomyces sp. 3211 TaxID=1964449 RepID=UPI0009A4E2A3|nr:AraC family transcriptional regulator [Streptomyces sp. 3211]
MSGIEPSTVAACYARWVLSATMKGADEPGPCNLLVDRLGFTEMRELWETVMAARDGDHHLGLLAGDRIRPGSLHVLGHVVLTCASLADAADAAVRYHPLVSQAGALTLHRDEDRISIRYRPTVDPATMHSQQVDAILAGMVRAGRWVAGDDWAPLSVSFTHPRAGSAEPYTRVLGCPVTFDAPENAITVSIEDLARRRAPSDPVLGALHRAYADRLLHELSRTVTIGERVRRWLEHAPLDCVSPADSVRGLNLGALAVRRALREDGTSWRALLDAARHQRAKHLLETTDLPLDRIAPLLGLSGGTALVRAFSRWEGVTPGVYRGLHAGVRR